MERYLIQSQTLTDIADAIREKANLASPLYPQQMPSYIRGIQTTVSEDEKVPEDIAVEAERLVNAMTTKISGNSVTFVAISDMHELGDSDNTDVAVIERFRRANRNAGQAAKLISEKMSLDFFANLGDYAYGANNTSLVTSYHDLVQSLTAVKTYTAPIADNTEMIEVPGNHDPLLDICDASGAFITNDLVTGIIGSYSYWDLENRKVRVIAMNTAEYAAGHSRSVGRMSGEQLQWFADSLDLSEKSDAENWGIIILAHHPLDWAGLEAAVDVLRAYLAGSAYSATHNGVAVARDYTGKNSATIISQFHGHTHCFKVANIGETSVLRVAIPNACFNRNNEYGLEGNYSFGEETRCVKTDDNTGRNTAFCLVSIDLSQKIIYADCFGSLGVAEPGINAGYDRVISYGEEDVVVYTVTNNLINSANSNSTSMVVAGEPYSASITANPGYELEAVDATMGGEPVAVIDGKISISAVTGDIVITATAKSTVVYNVTNLVETSEEQGSTAVYNGIGYKNGIYASENGDGTDASCVATGWIPYAWSPENVIYVRGASVTSADHVRFYGWLTKTSMNSNAYASGSRLTNFFSIETPEGDDVDYYKLTPVSKVPTVAYIRISLIGTGDNLIITVNEPIVADGNNEV